MNESATSILIAIIGAISGLLPVAITLIVNWAEQRADRTVRRRALESAHKQLEFMNLWIQTQQLICSEEAFGKLTNEVSEELASLRDEIQLYSSGGAKSRLLPDDIRAHEYPWERSKWQIAILGYLPNTAAGWIFHLLFYMALGACVLLTGWVIYSSFVYGNPGLTTLDWITMAYGPLVIAFGLTYLLFWMPARFITKKHRDTRKQGQSSGVESREH